MIRQFLIALVVIFIDIGYEGISLALDCQKAPDQISKDWEVEVDAAVAKIGPVSGGELKTKTKNATQDLLGKLPDAGRIYLEQMMFAAYCSSLRDDTMISESMKTQKLKEYIDEVRKTIKQASTAKPPPSKQPGKKKESGTRSQVSPPVPPLAQADSKQSNEQIPQRTPSQNPSISQHSEGANSPNITGDGNVVIIIPSTDALYEMQDLLRQKVDRKKLHEKYPLGYVIFEIDGNMVIPYETLSVLGEYQFDWTVVKVIQNTKDKIAIRLPDVKRKDGSQAITDARTGGRKQVGNLGGTFIDDLNIWGEILSIRENGIVFLVGFQRRPPFNLK